MLVTELKSKIKKLEADLQRQGVQHNSSSAQKIKDTIILVGNQQAN